ncbi:NAD(P)-dependent dehydrogenase (short-subunit alcohol dehydrogenase family) [Bacillus mesophilus]|uniref:SDR family oxidoreductase n=1 Tax=Bacillus mesophilus TaxID=1808955 RepID=A0A6M0QCM8_9BACI|nr:SDR family oxidoreductase [Bacillus mesophilus]MBM7662656.1 NAD(P)-dependent dehydrogenase (short-subunit alcohol dehydrogenase family) [Bacillus mesophilus]NEY73280.1 SDR family oxidoreductase [Bacillus mesophilus]
MNKDKRVVMITGATKGLGKALAFAFANENYRIAICARNEEEVHLVKTELEQRGAEVVAVRADVSNEKDVDRFVSVVENVFGTIDVLINNASIFGPGPSLLLDFNLQSFEEVLRVNIINPFLVTKRVLPGMLTRNTGSIINVTSEAGRTGFATWGAYGISKFAVEGMTQTWADELSDTGVRINMVDPGEMDTDMHEIAVPGCDYPLAKPEEVVDVFLYLGSEESNEINGIRFEAHDFSDRKGKSDGINSF